MTTIFTTATKMITMLIPSRHYSSCHKNYDFYNINGERFAIDIEGNDNIVLYDDDDNK